MQSIKLSDRKCLLYMATLLSDEIAAKLELKIKEMKIGEKLPSERMLAEEFGVSRNLLRESLQVLRDKGVIDILPGKGAYVSNKQEERLVAYMENILFDSSNNWKDVLEARRVIEIEACLKAVEMATGEDIQELERIYLLMEENRKHVKVFNEYDMAFHVQLAKASHNNIYSPLMMALFNISERKMFRITEMESMCMEAAQREHFAIIQALKNHDRQMIEQIAYKHYCIDETTSESDIKRDNQSS